jgi:hypothetical protein
VANKAECLRTLRKIEAADAESKRQRDLITDLEAELPKGVMEQRREIEATLEAYRNEQNDERKNENDLIDKIGQRVGAMNTNAEERKKAADQARDAFPSLERRLRRHEPAVGLESFARRVRAGYRKERSARDNPALVRNHFGTLLKEKRLSQRGAVNRLITAVQDYVLNNPDQHPGFEWTQFIEREQTPTLYDWITLRHQHLKETVLRNFKEQVDKAVLALVETMVHDFLSRLRANIDAVERTKEDLNRALRTSVFMNEVYQIRQERDQDKDTIRYLIDRLDIVAPKATALMQSASMMASAQRGVARSMRSTKRAGGIGSLPCFRPGGSCRTMPRALACRCGSMRWSCIARANGARASSPVISMSSCSWIGSLRRCCRVRARAPAGSIFCRRWCAIG